MLDAEADEMCKAHTKAGEVEVKMPRLRQQTFETATIERYRRRDISNCADVVGVSVRRVATSRRRVWKWRTIASKKSQPWRPDSSN